MTALALAGIALFAIAVVAIGVALGRRIPPLFHAVRARGVRGVLLAWALSVHAESEATRGYDTPSRARWPRG